MQQQGKNYSINKEQTYAELASLLILFLHSPSADIEHQLALFNPQLYLQLILNPQQPKEVRQACCASFKSQIINNKFFSAYSNSIIQQIQSAYFSLDDRILADIQGSFEILVERLFEMYLDDEKKLNAFANIMQRISNTSDIRSTHNNLRGIKLVFLLLRSMDPSTLNNEICIGQLMCYLKQIYHQKYQTNDPGSINGRGLQILQAAMGNNQCQAYLTAFVDLQIEIVKLVKEILQKLQVQQTEEGDSIPAVYLRNSNENDNLLQAILCVNNDGRVYGVNNKVNQLKANIIELYLQQYYDHISQPFFVLCLSTITKCDSKHIVDHVDTILSSVLQLLERSTSYQPYTAYFFNHTQILVLKLFELIAMGESQSDALENDPEHFAQISDDFCKNQEIECVKVRAGSLLYNLCLSIDGNLTFITNMAMIPLFALEREFVQKFMPSTKVRDIAIHNGKGLPVLLQLWSGKSPQGLTQASLLIISCISDLIIKRNQFHSALKQHLTVVKTLFSFKQLILNTFPPVIISRYIQLFSYFSFDGCLDVFLPYYSVKPVYGQTILKALETIMHFYDKKDEKMKVYVTTLSTKILLLSQRLTPLLQKIIFSRPELILCIKQKLIEKLVIWLSQFYQKQNIFGCNKISNILCKVIEQYPKFMIKTDSDGYNFDLQALNQYLIPLYKKIMRSKYHPAQQCIVDVAVSHIQCLGTNITAELLHSFVEMGVVVVENNEYVLNKCLELFSRTISIPMMQRDKENLQFMKLKNMQVDVAKYLLSKISKWIMHIEYRNIDQWQTLYLLQICLLVLTQGSPMLQQLSIQKLKNIYSKSKCNIVKVKLFMIWMLLVIIQKDDNNQAGFILQNIQIPQKIPPYEKNTFIIYMINTLPYFKNIQTKVHLIRAILTMFFPGEKEKKYLTNYQSLIHCGTNVSQAEIYAFQTVKTILHPINSMGMDTYKQFRVIYHEMGGWQQQRQQLTEKEEQMMREILGREMVGSKTRKIFHVKR